MKEYVLNYYPTFKCIASECKHTCCAGWQMNIDEQSLCAYKSEKSEFAKVLEKGIDFKKSQFKADKNGRCAFLNDKNLCEIIINLGEQSLCQVCRDHPRFRTFFDDRVETGLGFSCEQACKIILTFNDKIAPVLISDDGKENTLDFNQKNVLEFREKVLDIVQDKSEDINQRIEKVLQLCKANVSDKDFIKVIKTFLKLEKLDKSWAQRLKALKKSTFERQTSNALSHYAEQFLSNSLYRHLYDAEDTMWVRTRTIACVLSWWLIKGMIAQEGIESLDGVIDVVRQFSAEVEYSQNNLEKLFAFAYKFIKL